MQKYSNSYSNSISIGKFWHTCPGKYDKVFALKYSQWSEGASDLTSSVKRAATMYTSTYAMMLPLPRN